VTARGVAVLWTSRRHPTILTVPSRTPLGSAARSIRDLRAQWPGPLSGWPGPLSGWPGPQCSVGRSPDGPVCTHHPPPTAHLPPPTTSQLALGVHSGFPSCRRRVRKTNGQRFPHRIRGRRVMQRFNHRMMPIARKNNHKPGLTRFSQTTQSFRIKMAKREIRRGGQCPR
jgi:hypothetical protein